MCPESMCSSCAQAFFMQSMPFPAMFSDDDGLSCNCDQLATNLSYNVLSDQGVAMTSPVGPFLYDLLAIIGGISAKYHEEVMSQANFRCLKLLQCPARARIPKRFSLHNMPFLSDWSGAGDLYEFPFFTPTTAQISSYKYLEFTFADSCFLSDFQFKNKQDEKIHCPRCDRNRRTRYRASNKY